MDYMNGLFVIAYFIIFILLINTEYRSYKKNGLHPFHILLFFYLLRVIVPVFGVYAVLFMYPSAVTENWFFDKVLAKIDATQGITLLLLNILFIIGLYIVRVYFRVRSRVILSNTLFFDLRLKIVMFWLLFGVIVIGTFFLDLGVNFEDRYRNLILFRNLSDDSTRTFFSANAFSLTQTFAWLSAGLFFCFYVKKKYIYAVLLFGLTAFFALSMGSRRGILYPILILYFCFLFFYGKMEMLKMAKYGLPILLFAVYWISIGKEFTGSFAYGNENVGLYASLENRMLRVFSDLGVTIIESFATLQNFGFEPRFGVDHLLSFLRRIPGKDFMGLENFFPERIVRITTEIFLSPDDADVPPGLLGASWLDLPFIGALVWGAVLGGQAYFAAYFFKDKIMNPVGTMLMVIGMFIISLPIDTGSYDFTASVDMIFLVLILITSVKLRKLPNYGG